MYHVCVSYVCVCVCVYIMCACVMYVCVCHVCMYHVSYYAGAKKGLVVAKKLIVENFWLVVNGGWAW